MNAWLISYGFEIDNYLLEAHLCEMIDDEIDDTVWSAVV